MFVHLSEREYAGIIVCHMSKRERRKLYTAAQAFLEYNNDDGVEAEALIVRRYPRDCGILYEEEHRIEQTLANPMKWLLNRVVLYPEFRSAQSTIAEERFRREMAGIALVNPEGRIMSESEFAELVKNEFEHEIYGAIPLWKDLPKGKLAAFGRQLKSDRLNEEIQTTIQKIQEWGDVTGYTTEARCVVNFGYVPEALQAKTKESSE